MFNNKSKVWLSIIEELYKNRRDRDYIHDGTLFQLLGLANKCLEDKPVYIASTNFLDSYGVDYLSYKNTGDVVLIESNGMIETMDINDRKYRLAEIVFYDWYESKWYKVKDSASIEYDFRNTVHNTDNHIIAALFGETGVYSNPFVFKTFVAAIGLCVSGVLSLTHANEWLRQIIKNFDDVDEGRIESLCRLVEICYHQS